jgi:transposase
MDKRFLEECLEKGMSLEAIGEVVGKHPSTVSYWLGKRGLDARNAGRHAPKGALDKEQLEALVAAGLTLREIAERLDRSVATIRHWMGRYGLKTVRRRRQQPAGAPKRAELLCRRHGQAEFVLEGRGYYRCVKCRLEAVSRRRRTIKRTLVEEAGGQCILCGYSRCQRALQFHHLDPAKKSFHIGDRGHGRALERSREEARKCVLLCGNCHVEVEAGIVEMPLNSLAEADPG